MRTIGVAVLGLGNHAVRKTLPALAVVDGIRIVGICTRSEQVREEQASRWRCKAFPSPWAMLEDSEVDVVYVALPTGLHATWAKEVLAAGKHLWCEKSLTSKEEDWIALLAQARRSELALCECFAFFHHEQFSRIRELLFNGAIGGICGVTAQFGFPHFSRDNSRYSEQLGGGSLFDAGCYPIAAVRKLLGRKPSRVHALLERQEGYEVDTSGSALLRYCDGIHAHLEWGFGRSYRNEIEIWGETGSLRVEMAFSKPPSLPARIAIRSADAELREETFGVSDQFTAMFSNFRRTVTDAEAREHYWNDADEQREILFNVWRGGLSPVTRGASSRSQADLEAACA